ncbi:MAG: hypothetical protein K6G04_03495 [Lachnospiraceae bacterium]|nr:hypothetical protein [Lachnospiraceae bacterium]
MAETTYVQQIQNGKVVENTNTATESTKAQKASKDTKDMFLQLLVAEMKYQDPMEPTDNSEYVKELATFTQVETMQTLQSDVTNISANALSGKYVIMNAENGGAEGYVDFVKTDSSGTKISVDGKLYDVTAVETILDDTYHTALTLKDTLSAMIKELPDYKTMTYTDDNYKKVVALETVYSSLDAYQKTMISAEDQATCEKYISRMSELVAAKKASETEA